MYQGVPTLNPLPYVNIAMQARARKQARDEAIDKYYQNLPNTINDKGVRDQEIEPLNNMKADLFNYGIKNRDALRKGDGAALQEMQKKFREIQTYAQESKNRTATAEKLSKLRGNPKYDYIFRDPKLIDKIAKHEAPVGVQDSEAINFDQLTFPPAPFDRAKYIGGIKIKPNPTSPTYQDIPNDPLNRLEITGKQFSKDDLTALHIAAQTELENNPSFEKEIKENIQTNPAKAALMADIFQKNFGHPIQTDEDLAAAYTLSLMDLTPTQKTVPNKTAIADRNLKDWKLKEGIRQANRKELFGMQQAAKEAGQEANDLWIDAYIGKTVDEAKAGGKTQEYKFADGRTIKGYPIELDPVMIKALGFTDKQPGRLMVTEDGKFIPMFYKTDDNYQPIGKDGKFEIDATKTNIITQDALKLALGGKTGVKQLNKEMTNQQPATKEQKTKVSTGGYSRKDLLGAGWTDEQIDKAVKAGKIKLN